MHKYRVLHDVLLQFFGRGGYYHISINGGFMADADLLIVNKASQEFLIELFQLKVVVLLEIDAVAGMHFQVMRFIK